MPASFVAMQRQQTGAAAATEQNQLLVLTTANQNSCHITGLFGSAQGSGAGGGQIRLCRFSTAGAVGTGTVLTPAPTDPVMFTAAKTTTTFGTYTAGSVTRTDLVSSGIAQTGGMGGWIAIKPDQEKILAPNGGANGNAEVRVVTNGASQIFDYALEFNE